MKALYEISRARVLQLLKEDGYTVPDGIRIMAATALPGGGAVQFLVEFGEPPADVGSSHGDPTDPGSSGEEDPD